MKFNYIIISILQRIRNVLHFYFMNMFFGTKMLELATSIIAENFAHVGLIQELEELFNKASVESTMNTVNHWIATEAGGWVSFIFFLTILIEKNQSASITLNRNTRLCS